MAQLSVNILSNGMNLPVLKAYQALRPTRRSIELNNDPSGVFDVCVIIDDVPIEVEKIKARQFLFFGSETIYPADYFDSTAVNSFIKQFDGIYGPYPYDKVFKPFLPALPFMYNDNHGTISKPNKAIVTTPITEQRKLGLYTIVSNKSVTEYQYRRLKLFEYLSDKLGSHFHLYGNGFNPITSKVSIGHSFTHSIAVENRVNPFVISEKFYDPIILQNELFYLGGNVPNKRYTKFVNDIRSDSFDSIYAKVSDVLSNYTTSETKEKFLSDGALLALEDNFVSRIIDVITSIPISADFRSKKLQPIYHFKKKHLYRHPVQFLQWKYRGNFL